MCLPRSTAANPLLLVPQVIYATAPDDTIRSVDSDSRHSEQCTVEDVRNSFMRMAPHAFEFSELNEPGSFWQEVKLSKGRLIDFWGKVWNSFDFNESQFIDVKLPWRQQPLDVQILLAALETWFEPGCKTYLKDRVEAAGRALETDGPVMSGPKIMTGPERLERMLKYKHGLEPRGPSGTPSTVTSVPFPWLDIELSHFQHLGWRLLREENQNGEMIDYNDSYEPDDPYRQDYRDRSDHFTRWASGGLLMTSVRVPLPRPLFVDHWTLAQAVSEFYSWEHPLCMVDSAWRFVLEMCDSAPTTADLRAAMVYQISFAVQRTGALAGPWAHLADDDDFLWPYEKLRA